MTLSEKAAVATLAPGAGQRRAAFTSSWPPVAAWGAGLVQAALGAGAIMSADSDAGARTVGAVLVALGLVALAWGILCLRAERMLVPRATVGVAVAGVLLDATLLLLSPARTSVVGVGAAALLAMIVAVAAAATSRRAHRSPRPASVWGILVAAALVAVIVTPALGATQNAVLLRDDGTVPVISHDGH